MDKKIGQYLLINIGLSGFVNGIVKLTACVYRPWIRSADVKPLDSVFATATGYSFPSGHMANGVAVYGGLAVKKNRHRLFRNLMIILLVLIGFSRNYVGVHTPQDVLVSAGIGIVLLFAVSRTMSWVDQKDCRDLWVLVICIVLCILQVLYTQLKSYPMDYIDGKLIVDPEKMKLDSFGNTGMFLGTVLGWYLERRFIRFRNDVPKMTAVSRFVLGGIFIVLLYNCGSTLFALFLPGAASQFLGKMTLMFFITFLYPLIFTAWEKRHDKLNQYNTEE